MRKVVKLLSVTGLVMLLFACENQDGSDEHSRGAGEGDVVSEIDGEPVYYEDVLAFMEENMFNYAVTEMERVHVYSEIVKEDDVLRFIDDLEDFWGVVDGEGNVDLDRLSGYDAYNILDHLMRKDMEEEYIEEVGHEGKIFKVYQVTVDDRYEEGLEMEEVFELYGDSGQVKDIQDREVRDYSEGISVLEEGQSVLEDDELYVLLGERYNVDWDNFQEFMEGRVDYNGEGELTLLYYGDRLAE